MNQPKPNTRTVAVSHDNPNRGRSRAYDDSARMERAPIDAWAPTSLLETPPAVGGYHYRWIREYVNGHFDPQNVQRALRQKWERVRISELPEDFVVDEDKGDNYARTGGLILMRIHEVHAQQRQAHYQQRTRSALKGVNELQGIAGKHSFEEDKSRSITGAEATALLRSTQA